MATGIAVLERTLPLGKAPRIRTRRAADPRYDDFDSTEIQRISSGNLASGATTLYTCPTGRRARLFPGLIQVHNPTAGAVTYDLHHVESGGAAGTNNKLGPTVTVAVDATSPFLASTRLWHVMSGGDALVINTGGAGLNAWGVVLEERAEFCAFIGGYRGNLANGELSLISVPALRTAALDAILAFNSSAGSRTLSVWAKASSAAGADSNELIAQSIAAGAQAHIDLGLLVSLTEGGEISVKGSDAAGGLNVWGAALLM